MITTVNFIDVFAVTAALYRARNAFPKSDDPDYPAQVLDLTDLLNEKEWAPVKNAVGRAVQALSEGEPPEVVRVLIEKLPAGRALPWEKAPEEATQIIRFHIPIITNPRCIMYSGTVAAHITPGTIAHVDISQFHSAINAGFHARFHLVIDLKRPADEPK